MKSYMSVAGLYTVNSSIRRSPRSGLTDSLVDVALDPEHSGPVRSGTEEEMDSLDFSV